MAPERPPFELQPVLEGRLLRLRPLVPADFDALHAAASDPLIWEQHPEPDRWTLPAFQRYFDGAIASGGAFAVIERASGRVVGSSRYCDLDSDTSQVEIGWTFLERRLWGGEHNREMKALMLEHAFRFVERVVFVVGEHNLRSQKALARIGARLVGPTRDAGRDHRVIFELTRETYRGLDRN
jgi:RimJ/RimL family protein N-acetyltransferase